MKIFNTFSSLALSSRFPLTRWAPIPIRLIVGYASWNTGSPSCPEEWAAFAAILQAMGVPHPHFMAQLTILTELVGGFAVIWAPSWRLLVCRWRLCCLVAMFTVHLPYGFQCNKAHRRDGGPARNLDRRVTKLTLYMSPASRRSLWAALDHSP